MVFTCGKDGEVKQWDVDIFQRILTLKGTKISVILKNKSFDDLERVYQCVEHDF